MKKLLLVLAFTAMSAYCAFADVVISGHVRSYLSRNAIIDAEVRVPGTNVSVIANEDGFFSLKLDSMPAKSPICARRRSTDMTFLTIRQPISTTAPFGPTTTSWSRQKALNMPSAA